MSGLSTTTILFISLAAGLLAVVFLHFIKKGIQTYQARGKLLTAAEINFYRHLQRAIGQTATIFCMVRMADILTVKKSIKGKKLKQTIGPIAQKHLDFVLVDKDFNILCAVELNDKSHDRPDRIARDKFVRKTLKTAGIPLIEIPASRSYSIVKVQEAIANQVPSLLVSLSLPEAIQKKENNLEAAKVKAEVKQEEIQHIEEEPVQQTPEIEPDKPRQTLADIQYQDPNEKNGEKALSPYEQAQLKAQQYIQSLD
ncbi:MAG: hypothetical protein ACI9JN_000985 [Bacteroidia bacterium]|jgi:hypothetical protein